MTVDPGFKLKSDEYERFKWDKCVLCQLTKQILVLFGLNFYREAGNS